MRRLRALGVACAIVPLAGCGTGSVATSGSVVVSAPSPSPVRSPQASSGAIKKDVKSSSSLGAHLAVPPSDAKPLVTAEQARRLYQKTMPNPAWDGLPVSVSLVSFSDAVSGEEGKSGFTPRFTNVLSWAVIYRDVQIAPVGPPPPPGGSLSAQVKAQCDFAFIVDATTGAFVEAFDQCPGTL